MSHNNRGRFRSSRFPSNNHSPWTDQTNRPNFTRRNYREEPYRRYNRNYNQNMEDRYPRDRSFRFQPQQTDSEVPFSNYLYNQSKLKNERYNWKQENDIKIKEDVSPWSNEAVEEARKKELHDIANKLKNKLQSISVEDKTKSFTKLTSAESWSSKGCDGSASLSTDVDVDNKDVPEGDLEKNPCRRLAHVPKPVQKIKEVNKPQDLVTDCDINNSLQNINKTAANEVQNNLQRKVFKQLMNMSKDNLKKVVNEPKLFPTIELGMTNLIKETRLTLSQKLRELAATKIICREDFEESEFIKDVESLIDVDLAVDICKLPPELLNQIGNIFEIDFKTEYDFSSTASPAPVEAPQLKPETGGDESNPDLNISVYPHMSFIPQVDFGGTLTQATTSDDKYDPYAPEETDNERFYDVSCSNPANPNLLQVTTVEPMFKVGIDSDQKDQNTNLMNVQLLGESSINTEPAPIESVNLSMENVELLLNSNTSSSHKKDQDTLSNDETSKRESQSSDSANITNNETLHKEIENIAKLYKNIQDTIMCNINPLDVEKTNPEEAQTTDESNSKVVNTPEFLAKKNVVNKNMWKFQSIIKNMYLSSKDLHKTLPIFQTFIRNLKLPLSVTHGKPRHMVSIGTNVRIYPAKQNRYVQTSSKQLLSRGLQTGKLRSNEVGTQVRIFNNKLLQVCSNESYNLIPEIRVRTQESQTVATPLMLRKHAETQTSGKSNSIAGLSIPSSNDGQVESLVKEVKDIDNAIQKLNERKWLVLLKLTKATTTDPKLLTNASSTSAKTLLKLFTDNDEKKVKEKKKNKDRSSSSGHKNTKVPPSHDNIKSSQSDVTKVSVKSTNTASNGKDSKELSAKNLKKVINSSPMNKDKHFVKNWVQSQNIPKSEERSKKKLENNIKNASKELVVKKEDIKSEGESKINDKIIKKEHKTLKKSANENLKSILNNKKVESVEKSSDKPSKLDKSTSQVSKKLNEPVAKSKNIDSCSVSPICRTNRSLSRSSSKSSRKSVCSNKSRSNSSKANSRISQTSKNRHKLKQKKRQRIHLDSSGSKDGDNKEGVKLKIDDPKCKKKKVDTEESTIMKVESVEEDSTKELTTSQDTAVLTSCHVRLIKLDQEVLDPYVKILYFNGEIQLYHKKNSSTNANTDIYSDTTDADSLEFMREQIEMNINILDCVGADRDDYPEFKDNSLVQAVTPADNVDNTSTDDVVKVKEEKPDEACSEIYIEDDKTSFNVIHNQVASSLLNINASDGVNSPAPSSVHLSEASQDDDGDSYNEVVQFKAHKGPILALKVVGKYVLAASEDCLVYCYSLRNGKRKRIYPGHTGPVSCLAVVLKKDAGSAGIVYTGSFDGYVRAYSIHDSKPYKTPICVEHPVQCIDENWGILFVGLKNGHIVKVNCKTMKMMGSPIEVSQQSVLCITTNTEGPRKVLVTTSRNNAVVVRDATSCLLLRTINYEFSGTVFSILIVSNIVYCGNNTSVIFGYDFTTGDLICKLDAGPGVVSMKQYNGFIFASSYDGNVYIFNHKERTKVAVVPSQGKMLLDIDLYKAKKIILSNKCGDLESHMVPLSVRNYQKRF